MTLTITGKSRLPGFEGMEHHVTYTYRARDGAMRTESEVVPQESWDLIAVGDRFPATIRDHWTETVTIHGTPDPVAVAARWILLAGGAGLLLATAVAVGRKGGQAWAAVRALRHGEVRQARVTGHEAAGPGAGRMTWIDAAGAAGRSMPRPLADLQPAGSIIVVYADPVTEAA